MEFIKENKKVRKQENTLSTKKAIKTNKKTVKKKKCCRFLGRESIFFLFFFYKFSPQLSVHLDKKMFANFWYNLRWFPKMCKYTEMREQLSEWQKITLWMSYFSIDKNKIKIVLPFVVTGRNSGLISYLKTVSESWISMQKNCHHRFSGFSLSLSEISVSIFKITE